MNDNFFKQLIEKAQETGINRYVVGAVISKDDSVLLLQRPKDDFMGGIFELPSGKMEAGETINVALFREVEEETGLQIEKIVSYLGHFDYESKSGRKTRQFNFTVTVSEPHSIKLTEHDDYAWVNSETMHNHKVTDKVVEVLGTIWEQRIGNK